MENKNSNIINVKFKELTENVDFMEKVLESKSEKEVRSLFEKEGIILSDNDVQYLSNAISEIAKKTGIIPEEELSTVAGGITEGAIGGAVGFASGVTVAGVAGLVGAVYAFKRGMDYSDSWWNKVSTSLKLQHK